MPAIDQPATAASIPMTPMDEKGVLADPLTVAIAHAFEVYDLDDIETQDGDMLRGLARLAGATVQAFEDAESERMERKVPRD